MVLVEEVAVATAGIAPLVTVLFSCVDLDTSLDERAMNQLISLFSSSLSSYPVAAAEASTQGVWSSDSTHQNRGCFADCQFMPAGIAGDCFSRVERRPSNEIPLDLPYRTV